ncbi:DUF3558 domain-containing protein [Micromonospora sp. 15K316]|uniref:DUF3558 family protein n=1 Tax=Micromonospora sp. 15K316 TaxID=2530376 RepID=UPI0010456DAB|nr:DUF3558 family protein [Micromonospora sp. 15K316]TDC29623.1 DUF3558 domain-containing protein [Micromonospora sp. 15K316]
MRQTRRTARPAALLLAGLLPLVAGSVAGCGSDQEDPPPASVGALPSEPPASSAQIAPTAEAPATVDPCALVTRKEAERLAGTGLGEAKPIRETCTYNSPADGPTAQVEVFVGPGAKKFLDIERELGHELRALAGVGDEAYASQEAVFVSRSGQWVSVRLVRLNDPAENRAPLEQVARTVAGRI